MGSFTFKWANPTTDPSDVLVTGSFDGWTKSVKLEEDRGIFQKTVEFSEKDAANKIYYKFVVDNNWIINESYPYEPDHEGNVNNFLTSEDLVKPTPAPGSGLVPAPFINTVTPESTTVADMGKKNNKKGKVATKQAGAEATPAEPAAVAAAAAAAPEIAGASETTATPSDVPGGFPSTPSNEGADWENKTVSINPLPATAGTGNPITLAPGEKIPESMTSQNVNEHVKLDKASYEKSDALPTAPALSTEAPSVSGVMIPESSLFMGEQTDVTNATINSVGAGSTTAALAGRVPLESKVPDATNATINSVGPGSTTAALAGRVPLESKVPDATNATINSVGAGSTTAALAGQVPLESKVPDVVKESQEKASVAPKASTMPEEVKDKAKVEEEIRNIVPEAPATSVGTAGVGTEKKENTGTVLGAAAAAGGAAVTKFSTDAAPAVNDAKNATAEIVSKNLPDSVKNSLPVSAQNALATEKTDSPTENVSPAVPREVKESIAEAGKSPEAAVSTSAVQDKRAVESELLKEVKEAPAVSDVAKSSPAADTKVTESTPVMTKPVETRPVAVKAVDEKPVDVKPAETHPAAATTASAAAATTTETPSTTANTTTIPTAANDTETKIMEPSSTTTAAAANGNGSEAKPAGSTMGDKKKNRLSVMLGKLKAKLK